MPFKKILIYTVLGILVLLLLSGITYLTLPDELRPVFARAVGVAIIIIAYLVILIDLIFLLPTVRGAIYYPSSDTQIDAILKLAQIKKGEKAVDIGSGDGRIVTALAKAGAKAHGYEINLLLVWWSQWLTRLLPKEERGQFHWANLWMKNFSSFDIVTIFGMTYIMKDLEKKLLKELKPGSRVICNSFPFPNWKPAQKIDSVYLYIKE